MENPGSARIKAERAAVILVAAVLSAVIYFVIRPQWVGEEVTLVSSQEAVFEENEPSSATCTAAPGMIPSYSGEDVITLNGNVPNFTKYDLETVTGETYSVLDPLGRCGPACAMLYRSMLPKEDRGEIGSVKPSGFRNIKYPDLIDDGFLYHRSHLIAFSLTGQNDNPENLITGTQHMNMVTMPVYEKEVLACVAETRNHVLYRVTPYFKGNELVARGVEMEAYSVEDEGKNVCFHVFLYNVQPGIVIDYKTGISVRGR